jgi:nitroreductase
MAAPENDLFEIIYTTRAMRRLKPDPIPRDLIRRILRAAVCAPNAGNRQLWRFLVIENPDIKKRVQPYYQRALEEWIADQYRSGELPVGVTRSQYERQFSAVRELTKRFHEAPVWIVPCLDEDGREPSRFSGASIYPAVQNILLAARALGLGATLTTRHMFYEQEVEEILGLPEGVYSYAIIPLGYPKGRFGPVGRKALSSVVFHDRWGQPYPDLE